MLNSVGPEDEQVSSIHRVPQSVTAELTVVPKVSTEGQSHFLVLEVSRGECDREGVKCSVSSEKSWGSLIGRIQCCTTFLISLSCTVRKNDTLFKYF